MAKYASWMTPAERDVADRFPSEVATHVMTVVHNKGVYRHLRFARPGRSIGAFELVTWPGSLAVRGDMGSYLFSRDPDMFGFFRRNGTAAGINAGYWAEELQCEDRHAGVEKYSEDLLRAEIEDHLTRWEKEYPDALTDYEEAKAAYDALPLEKRVRKSPPVTPKSPEEIRDLIADYDDNGELSVEEGARRLLRELESGGGLTDTWEMNLSDWDIHFLRCCHAIVWGIAQYDARPRPWWKRWLRRG